MSGIPGNPARPPPALRRSSRSPPGSALAQAIAVPDKTLPRRLYEIPVRPRSIVAWRSGSSSDCQRQTSCVPPSIRDQRQMSGRDLLRGSLDGTRFGRRPPGKLSLAGMAARRPGARPSDRTSRNFASFWNIAHLRFPLARRPVSGRGRLAAATNPHAATAVATILDVLRPHQSDRIIEPMLPLGVLPICFSSGLKICPNGMSPTAIAEVSPGRTGVKGFAHIPLGG
jgi:hypothetical protein